MESDDLQFESHWIKPMPLKTEEESLKKEHLVCYLGLVDTNYGRVSNHGISIKFSARTKH